MKFGVSAVCCLVIFSAPAASFAQTPAAPSGPVSALSVGKQMYTTIKGYLLASAEKLPEADYAFKPTPEVRSFGGILGHVATALYGPCAALKGEQNPNKVNFEEKTARAELIAAIKEGFAYCDAAIAGLSDDGALEMVKRGQRDVVRIAPLFVLVAHLNEHYGNLVTYMRLKGVVPPSSDKPGTSAK